MSRIKKKMTIIIVVMGMLIFIPIFASIILYTSVYLPLSIDYSFETEINLSNDKNDETTSKILFFKNLKLFNVHKIALTDSNDQDYFVEKDDDVSVLSENKENISRNKLLKEEFKKRNLPFGITSYVKNELGHFYIRPIRYENSEEKFLLYTDVSKIMIFIENLKIIIIFLFFLMLLIAVSFGIYVADDIEQQEEYIKYFFQNTSHELKTPLMSIKGYAHAIKNGLVDDYEGAADIIIEQSGKMQNLIDEIINISRLDSKDYVFENKVFDIVDVIDDSLQNFQPFLREHNILLETEFNSENNLIRADQQQIYKAVNTVLDNSVKHAKSTVKITTFINEIYLNIEIYNDGTPISQEILPHVFERFYSHGNFSSGIGLAMARQIILKTGANIKVKI